MATSTAFSFGSYLVTFNFSFNSSLPNCQLLIVFARSAYLDALKPLVEIRSNVKYPPILCILLHVELCFSTTFAPHLLLAAFPSSSLYKTRRMFYVYVFLHRPSLDVCPSNYIWSHLSAGIQHCSSASAVVSYLRRSCIGRLNSVQSEENENVINRGLFCHCPTLREGPSNKPIHYLCLSWIDTSPFTFGGEILCTVLFPNVQHNMSFSIPDRCSIIFFFISVVPTWKASNSWPSVIYEGYITVFAAELYSKMLLTICTV